MIAVSFGGGVNSTALLVGFAERGIRPDVVMFADTGRAVPLDSLEWVADRGERRRTYEHVRAVSAWCEARGWAPIAVVNRRYAEHESLEQECLNLKTLPSKAFGYSGCSVKWKRQPMDAYLTTLSDVQAEWAQGRKVTRALGIDAGESHRGLIPDDEHFHYVRPLVEWDWSREECVEAIRRAGLEVPPKSACFFCPAMKKQEIVDLAIGAPDLFARAVAMERNAKENLGAVKGLGRHRTWERFVKESSAVRNSMPEPGDQLCFCFDGEAA